MFGIVFLLLGTLMHAYVSLRLYSVPGVRGLIPAKGFAALSISIWALFLLGRLVGHGGGGPVAASLEFAGMTWMGILFLSFVSLLAIDLVTCFGLLFSRFAPHLRGAALVAAAILSLVALVQGFRPPVVEGYEVALKGLPPSLDGTVVVGISDLHVGSTLGKGWLLARVRQVEALDADIVVLLGDLFEGHGQPIDEHAAMLKKLSAPMGVFAVAGNHEHYNGEADGAKLSEGGRIQVLHNRWVPAAPGLVVAGVDDLTENRRSGKNEDMVAKALAGRPPGATILLSHTPWQVEHAAAQGAELMLSGHTHGGQLWPMGYLTRLFYPLMAGRYEIGKMTLIVCRGTGTWGPRMRLWRPGEIMKVTLRARGNGLKT